MTPGYTEIAFPPSKCPLSRSHVTRHEQAPSSRLAQPTGGRRSRSASHPCLVRRKGAMENQPVTAILGVDEDRRCRSEMLLKEAGTLGWYGVVWCET
jgi:hypothetical protein